METHIYGLISVNNPNEIRYVGKSNNIYYRLKRHIRNTKLAIKKNIKLTHKDYWFIKNNFKIGVVLLETCDESIWGEREKYWISKFSNLTNTSSGGLGGSGLKYFLSYEEVKSWIKENMNVKSKNDWYKQIKNINNNNNIPKEPREVYLNRGWVSWGDFLGTNKIANQNKNFMSYDDFKIFIKNNNIKTYTEFKNKRKNLKKLNEKMPTNPNITYKNSGWISWASLYI